MKDAQFIGVITSMAAPRKTDVYAFAQCSQLFPFPREYCCADSQILTHSATAFEEYFPPFTFTLSKKEKKSYFKCVPLESTYFSQTFIEFSRGFITNTLKVAIIIFILSPELLLLLPKP